MASEASIVWNQPGVERIPRSFGRLWLLRRLARGGMGEVYLAATAGLEGAERPCVVKIIRRDHASDRSFLARFLDEARVQAQLQHHGVAQVLEASTDPTGEPYVVVEYVEGRSLGEVRTVVDIGANRGQFALAARNCSPDARIVSFEPLPGPAETFRQVFSGDARVVLHPVAIGQVRREMTIHISAADDSSSLLPITAMQRSLFPGTGEVGTAVVQVAPLSEFLSATEIEQPALLKLDVQGYELEALKGCEGLLGCFAYVYAECSFIELYEGQPLADTIIAWLRERGFRLEGIYNLTYNPKGRGVQGDFLYVHN